MKKRIYKNNRLCTATGAFSIILILAFLAVAALGGCGQYTINLIKDEFVVNVNDELSTDVADYVRASKAMLSEMELDVSQVDVTTIGKYKATVTHGEDSRSFTIEVADIEAPKISLKSEEIYFELQGTLHLDDIVASVKDYSDFEYGFSEDMTLADSDKTMVDSLFFSGFGDYNAEIIARDKNGNIAVSDFRVHVVEQGKAGGRI